MLPDRFVKSSIDFLLFVNAGVYFYVCFDLSDECFKLLKKVIIVGIRIICGMRVVC